tara:strand:- start:4106 stop:6994 length:2889 start_codon:yes stop_codon:yes gene_type:complete
MSSDNSYIEMGFNPIDIEEAISRYGTNHSEAVTWLLQQANVGHVPKKLKIADAGKTATYYGSEIRCQHVTWLVDDYDEQHALIRLRTNDGRRDKKGIWIHISDDSLEWVAIHHRQPNNKQKHSPAWRRQVGQIQFPRNVIRPAGGVIEPSTIIQTLLSTRPCRSHSHHGLWEAVHDFQHCHAHWPSPTAPVEPSTASCFALRYELMTYFLSLCDIYNVSKSVFMTELDISFMSELRTVERLSTVLRLFPELLQPTKLKTLLIQWLNPYNSLTTIRDDWWANVLPLVEFEYHSLSAESFCLNVFFHDMTFVKQTSQLASKQRLFQTLFSRMYSDAPIVGEEMTSLFWKQTMKLCQKKYKLSALSSKTFITQLLPFQQQALHWMQWRETAAPPLSAVGWQRHQLKDGFAFYTDQFGQLSHTPPQKNVRGGILAQGVGMGKTVEMLALIASDTCPKPTLVIMPAAMLKVWINESKKHTPLLNIYKYHGAKRTLARIQQHNVVYTTFRIVQNDYVGHGSGENNSLESIEWGRVIVDEAHLLPCNSADWCKTVLQRLRTDKKWCISSTPFDKEMKNVTTMFKFFNLTPFNTANVNNKEYNNRNALLIRGILTPMTYSQTREEVQYQLPRSIEEVINCENRHQISYSHLCKRIQKDIIRYADVSHSIRERLAKKYKWWLSMAAIHPCLLPLHTFAEEDSDRQHTTKTTTTETFVGTLSDSERHSALLTLVESCTNGKGYCSICMGTMERPTMTHCQHLFCFECIHSCYSHDQDQKRCPLCRETGIGQSLVELTQVEKEAAQDSFFRISLRYANFKIPIAIHKQLMAERHEKSEKISNVVAMCQSVVKTVIFTQHSLVLSLLATQLTCNHISFVVLKGKMTIRQREKVIQTFHNDNTRVFIMCLKTKSFGVDLSNAQQIIFTEPIQDIALKKQAISRVVKIGNKNKVVIKTLFTQNTIDDLEYNTLINI